MTIIAFGQYVLTDKNEMAGLSHLRMRSRGTPTWSDLDGTRDHTLTCQQLRHKICMNLIRFELDFMVAKLVH